MRGSSFTHRHEPGVWVCVDAWVGAAWLMTLVRDGREMVAEASDCFLFTAR